MKKFIVPLLLFTLYWLFFVACGIEKIPIPNFPDTVSTVFDPGKVKYIPINPAWEGDEYGFVSPVDIVISVDDYIFIADSGAAEITVLNKTGEVVQNDEYGNDFSALYEIYEYGVSSDSARLIHPVGIAVDSKLNLFIVENSGVIYVWNQYINTVGVDSIATEVEYYNPESGEHVNISDFTLTRNLEDNGYILQGGKFSSDSAVIDSILSPHPFYICQEESRFVSVAAAPFGFNRIYAADELNQRIPIIELERSAFLKLKDGSTVWQHKGVLSGFAATQGTGAGTVNYPRGMFVDNQDNIFYTQIGENFGVHKIRYIAGSDMWVSVFNLGESQIMDLGRFHLPHDVAVDEQGHIFVANTGENEIQEFDEKGQFVRKVGLREVQIDTTVIDTVLIPREGGTAWDTTFTARDTLITRYYNDMLSLPKGVFVDAGVVYVLDTGNRRILRFRLSSDIDIEIPE